MDWSLIILQMMAWGKHFCYKRLQNVARPLILEERKMTCNGHCSGLMPVYVRQYDRFRNGQWEVVCEHCRSLPRR